MDNYDPSMFYSSIISVFLYPLVMKEETNLFASIFSMGPIITLYRITFILSSGIKIDVK